MTSLPSPIAATSPEPAASNAFAASLAALVEGTDAAASKATSYRIEPGDSFDGRLATGADHDWIAVRLEFGHTYEFDLSGRDPDGVGNPFLQLRDANGVLIAEADDRTGSLDSHLVYIANRTGIFYLDAGGHNDVWAGDYRLSVTQTHPAPAASVAELAAFLTDGYWESEGESRRSFDTGAPGTTTISVNISGLTAAGKRLALMAFEAWEMVADLDFTVTTGAADIRFDDENPRAYSTSATSGGLIDRSFVNVSRSWLSDYGATADSYGFSTYIHEIGHAIGLGHQGPYNGAADHATDAIFANDTWRMSVMSYFDQTDDATYPRATYATPTTAMMADIAAVQVLYGEAQGGGTSGGTTWGAGGTTDTYLDALFAALSGAQPDAARQGGNIALTVHDTGGHDRIDLGFDTHDQRVNLASGSFSDAMGGRGNLAISQITVIEDYSAGSGDDRVLGNSAGNTVQGGRGSDNLQGGAGADRLLGGKGGDRLSGGSGDDRLAGGAQADLFVFGSGMGRDVVADLQDGIDTLRLDDALWGGGRTVAQVVARAIESGGSLVFNWGANRLTLLHVADANALLDDIAIF